MSARIRTALIGIGRWGTNVARELNAVSELVAYASRSRSGNDAWLAEHIPSARRSTIEEICADPSLKAVAIATPISTHADIAGAMLGAGKHALVEKPLAHSSIQAQGLAEMASARGLTLATGYQFLYHPVCHELKRQLDVTSVRRVTFEWRKYGTFGEPIAWNLLTHHLALALDLLGEPIKGGMRPGGGSESECDEIETRLVYGQTEVVSLIDRRADVASHTMQFDLEDGSSFVWNGDRLLHRKDRTATPQLVFETRETSLAIEIAAFIKAAAGGELTLPTGGIFGARVLRIHEMLELVK